MEEDPSDSMEYTAWGEMQAINQNERGIQTIHYFNLNERRLQNRRKEVSFMLQNMKNDYTEDELVELIGEFESMIRQLY